jgi:hypothetical protein
MWPKYKKGSFEKDDFKTTHFKIFFGFMEAP